VNKRGLGRGLQALLPNVAETDDGKEKIIELSVKEIRVNKNQPRRFFNEEKLNELALSIKEHGVVQPIIVRRLDDGKYELVAGERRWRASQIIGLKKIPAIIKQLSSKETSEIALIENIQREDLNPIEEAAAYKALMEEFGLTQEVLSQRVGKSRPFIANTVRLLSLPENVRNLVSQGSISAGHARALIALPGKKDQEELAQKVAQRGLSVRQTEKTIRDILADKKREKSKLIVKDPNLNELEERLTRRFSTKVRIARGSKSGKIEIEYYGDEELQRLLETLLGEIEL